MAPGALPAAVPDQAPTHQAPTHPAPTDLPPTARPAAATGGLALLRVAWRLLTVHWLPLLVIAVAGVAAHWYLRDLAIWLGRRGAVPGMLGLSLVPFSTLLCIVAMLLVLRRRERSSHVLLDLLVATGSVLVPFLVVYQSGGGLIDDLRHHAYFGIHDDFARMDMDDVDGTARLPDSTSTVVLAVVGIALAFRVVGARAVAHERLWRGRDDPRRTGLQVIVGYFEMVWIVLAGFVIAYATTSVSAWWQTRAVNRWVTDWWEGVSLTLPPLGAFGSWLAGATGTLVEAAAIALVVPVAWLAIGVVVYGVQATDVIVDEDITRAGRATSWLARLTARVGDTTVTRAWWALAEPNGRFGALFGGLAMILKAGWSAVLVFCLAYLAVTHLLQYVVWGAVRLVAGSLSPLAWNAWWDPLETVTEIGSMMASAALLAAGADQLLQRFGAPAGLRLPGVPVQPTGSRR